MNNLSTTCEGGRFFPAWTIVFDERSVDNSDDDDDDYHFWEHVCQPKILDFSSIVFFRLDLYKRLWLCQWLQSNWLSTPSTATNHLQWVRSRCPVCRELSTRRDRSLPDTWTCSCSWDWINFYKSLVFISIICVSFYTMDSLMSGTGFPLIPAN